MLELNRLQKLTGFGRAHGSLGYLYRPTHVEQINEIFALARQNGLSIGLRGAGRSYGDAALNSGQIVLDMQRMNRILAWNPETGIIRVEPGVTIQQLWQYTIEDGWPCRGAWHNGSHYWRLPGNECTRQKQLPRRNLRRPCA